MPTKTKPRPETYAIIYTVSGNKLLGQRREFYGTLPEWRKLRYGLADKGYLVHIVSSAPSITKRPGSYF